MAIQHLTSSTANKRPTPAAMADAQIAINSNTASPGLFFKDSAGALIKVGPVHVGTTAPNASPASGGQTGNTVGEQWLDTSGSTYVFKVWDGTAWRSEAGEFVNTTGDTMTGALGIIAGSASTPGLFISGDTNTGIYSPGADQLAISTNGTERLFVDASGQIGIGTTNPGSKTEIVDTLQATANNRWSLVVRGDDSGTDGESAQILLSAINTTTRGVAIAAERQSNTNNHDMLFKLSSASAAPTEKVRIDSSGRLLINTSTARTTFLGGATAPKIQIESTGSDASLSIVRPGASPYLLLGSTGTAALGDNTLVPAEQTLGSLEFVGANGTNVSRTAAYIRGVAEGTPTSGSIPGRLVFSTTADGQSSPTERMRISANGSIFTGGATSAASIESGAQPGKVFKYGTHEASSGATITTQAFHLSFANPNGFIGSISTSGSATAYNTSSDYRLKENVVPLTGAVDRLKQLPVRRFNFIADPGKTVDGFIAHEAQAVVPECVTGTEDEVDADGKPVYQGIDQSKLVPLLTAALQEALQKIEVLEQRLTDAGIV